MNYRKFLSLVAVCAVLLSACSATPEIDKSEIMTPEEAKSQVSGLLTRAQSIVGAGEWAETRSWGPCPLAGREGEVQWTLGAQLFVSLTGEPRGYAAQVADEWRNLGLSPTVSSDTSPSANTYIVSDPAAMTGTRPDGSFTQISISPNVIFFRGNSVCVRGRLEDLEAPSESTVTPPSSP